MSQIDRWLHSECAQVLDFINSLDLMFVLLHISRIWLPRQFWSTNEIVAVRTARPTLRGVRIGLGAIIVGTTIVGTRFEGVIVVFFFEVGLVEACILGALDRCELVDP